MEQQLCSEGCASYPPKIPLRGVDEVFHSQELLWIPKSCMEMDKPAMQASFQQDGFPEKHQPAFLGKGQELMEPLKLFITLKMLGSF